MINGAMESLTEIEQLKLENLALRYAVAQQQVQQIVADRNAYIRQIEAAHPGYVWQEQRGLVEQGVESQTDVIQS